ncbi:MAG: hypothetical protein MZV64_29040 [Ignavibacteriales bacterium]|nr:hypothetical protein [Ignavibacteriales bacterium]
MTLAEIAHALASAGALDPGAKTGEARGGSLSRGSEASRRRRGQPDALVRYRRKRRATTRPRDRRAATLAAKDGGIGPSASSSPIDVAIADPETWRSIRSQRTSGSCSGPARALARQAPALRAAPVRR